MSSVVLSSGNSDINLDFADVQTVMSHRGMALMGVGESDGDGAAIDAVKNAIESPLLDNMSINGALGVLVHFHLHPDSPLSEISEAMNVIFEAADEDAHVIFGTTTDEKIENNRVRVTIVATGFEKAKEVEKEHRKLDLTHESMKRERILRMRKVSGGFESSDDYLDIPAYIRNQMD